MSTETQTNELGDTFEEFLRSAKRDAKGRVIGYVVGQRDNGTDFYAWVQCARGLGNGEWVEFGVTQRSRRFASQSQARDWAYRTAKERIAKLA